MENTKYYLVKLRGQNNQLISIHEKKKINKYTKINGKNMNSYNILVEVEKKVGEDYYGCFGRPLLAEPYMTYEFKNVEFSAINDFAEDLFDYDPVNNVVLYGFIYGIYVSKIGDDYHDVVTDQIISHEIIETVSEINSVEDYDNMISDLTIIAKNKYAYTKLMKEIIIKLLQGAYNRKLAREIYNKKYDELKKAQDELSEQSHKHYLEECEKMEQLTIPQKQKVKELIKQIHKII